MEENNFINPEETKTNAEDKIKVFPKVLTMISSIFFVLSLSPFLIQELTSRHCISWENTNVLPGNVMCNAFYSILSLIIMILAVIICIGFAIASICAYSSKKYKKPSPAFLVLNIIYTPAEFILVIFFIIKALGIIF